MGFNEVTSPLRRRSTVPPCTGVVSSAAAVSTGGKGCSRLHANTHTRSKETASNDLKRFTPPFYGSVIDSVATLKKASVARTITNFPETALRGRRYVSSGES